jgi:hypothetical protein
MTEKTRSRRKVVKDKFFALLEATSLADGLGRDHIYLGRSYGRNCLLLGWSHQPYEEAIKAVHEIRPEVSEKTIGDVLTRSMVKLFHQHNVREDADPEADAPVLDSILETLDSSAVNEEVTNFLELLKSRIKTWTAFVFLEGVELKGLVELPLGVATLHPKDRGPLRQALEDMAGVEGLRDIPQYIDRDTEHCRCYLTVDVEGEDRFASQEALRQAQDVANVLNLYATSSRHRVSFYERIGIVGQPTTTRRQFVLKLAPPISDGSSGPRQYAYFTQNPLARYHEVNLAQIQQWRQRGLDKVLECIGVLDAMPGSVESRIRNAVTWYGRAMNTITPDEQFVGLVTALESLLVADEKKRKRVHITQRLGDVVSVLVGDDFESRERIKERMKKLYDLRGRIVHAGMPVPLDELFALNRIVADTILAFVCREMPSC